MTRILIITSSFDETVTYLVSKYPDNRFYRIDVDKFFAYKFDIGCEEGWRVISSEWTVAKYDVDSIYYRKPTLPDLSEYEEKYHGMMARDIISLINGIVDDFDGVVLTRPGILRKAENKTYQLLYAARTGLNVPKSYIGNSIEAVEAKEWKKSIIKPLTTGKVIGKDETELYQTSYFEGTDEDISLTPVYLQEYQEKQYEVRLTIVGDDLYPVRIDTEEKLDWRRDYSKHHYSLVECPPDVVKKCRRMLRDFDLKYGAFDFIVNPSGDWIFLEVNPNGQWLWLEDALGLSISESIMKLLCVGEDVKALKKLGIAFINMILWIWSHSLVIPLSDDENFGTLEWKNLGKASRRFSLFSICMGEWIVYLVSLKPSFSIFHMISLSEISGAPDGKIEGLEKKYREHLKTCNDMESEKEDLLYHIDQEQRRIDTSLNKANAFSAIVLAVIPIFQAIIKKEFFSGCQMGILVLLIYSLCNVLLFIYQTNTVGSISKSSFADLKKSEAKKTELNAAYYYDWQQQKYKADYLISLILNLQRWVLFSLLLLFCIWILG